ncbi:MAG: SusC/RagA family TonB-linked outer membrane protein [Bacteroidales bacterium]|nr:SusC/RagA family TonB-linked outer membrane protein [Bacteroidales bacterium]
MLKDAASSALYGARGANGVIIITTKKGQAGTSVINFDAKWGANSRGSRDYDRITSPGAYYELYYKGLYNYYVSAGATATEAHRMANKNLTASSSSGGLGYCVYTVPENEYLIGTNGRLNPNATLGNRIYRNGQIYTLLPDDWTDETYRTGLRQEYNLSLSGGSETTQIYASFGYLKDEGIVKASDFERFSGRLRASYQAKKWLYFGANAAFSHTINNASFDLGYTGSTAVTGGVFSDAANVAPIYPLYVRDENGNILYDRNGKVYDWGDGTYNTDGIIRPSLTNSNSLNSLYLEQYRSVINSTAFDAFADIMIPFGFKVTIKGGANINENRNKYTFNPYYGYSSSTGGGLNVGSSRVYAVNLQQLLNWTRSFNGHNISAMIGHESYRYRYQDLEAYKTGAVDYSSILDLNGYLSYPSSPTSYTEDYNTEGYLARALYDYQERYFFQGSFRRDASSRFHPKKRWGNFWSLGGAWIISREDFFHATWVDNLKIKASYGEVGNDNIGYYRYVDTYTITNVNGEPSLTLKNKGNPDITWETISNLNAGVEFDLFQYRLTGNIEFYNKKSADMLLWFTAPSTLGYSGYYKNVGDMRNTGIDVTLTGTPIRTKDINWNISVNFNYNHQRVTYLPSDNKTLEVDGHGGYQNGDYFIGEGLSLNTFYIPKYAGVNEEGLGTWYVTNSDGSVTTTTNYSSATNYLIDCAQPVKGGFGTTLNAFGFDLSAQFAFGLGGKSYDLEYSILMTVPTGAYTGFAIHKDMLNAWSAENPTSNIPRWQYGDTYTGVDSDRYLVSSDFLSFQSAQLGYTIPTKIVKRLGLTKLRVYCAGENIYLWTKRKGFDPRLSQGYGDYSPIRTISGGINLQF